MRIKERARIKLPPAVDRIKFCSIKTRNYYSLPCIR
jgi:hypothetical protein